MKRFVTALLAAATFATPVALPAAASAQHWRGDRDRDGDRDHRRNRDRDRDGDRDRDHRRGDRWDRDDRRDGRDHRRWDRRRYNGYWHSGRFHYGPPPSYYNDARYEWRSWRRGDRLPSYYRSHYDRVDWRHHHLRAPPRGYHYVEDDRGDYLLVGIATGVILGVILANQ